MSTLHGEEVVVRHDTSKGVHSFEHDLDREAAKKYYDAAREHGKSVYTSPTGEKIKFVHDKENDKIEIHRGHHDD